MSDEAATVRCNTCGKMHAPSVVTQFGFECCPPVALCTCEHSIAEHNEDGCMYPDPAKPHELAFCPCAYRRVG